MPLVIAVAFGWSAGQVLLLYWTESALVAYFALRRVWTDPGTGALIATGLFVFLFGDFMLAHLGILLGLFIRGPFDGGGLQDPVLALGLALVAAVPPGPRATPTRTASTDGTQRRSSARRGAAWWSPRSRASP